MRFNKLYRDNHMFRFVHIICSICFYQKNAIIALYFLETIFEYYIHYKFEVI